jgi:HD-GYP domain-containing protein (c-di-GMP phosphodiesterase class II)
LGGSTSHIALRFAAISVLTLCILAGLAAFAGWQVAASSQRSTAAGSADRLVGTPVRTALERLHPAAANGALSPDARAQLDAITTPLISGDLRGILLWTADGQVAYQAGDITNGRVPRPQVHGVASANTVASDGTALFTTYAAAPGYTVEIDQAATPLDHAILTSRLNSILAIALGWAVVCVLLQVGFWFATRTVAYEHRRLVRLHASGEDLRSSLDLQDVIAQVSGEATTLARANYSLVALFEPETSDLILRATYDGATGAVAHQQRAIEEWFLRRAVITNTTIVSAQAAKAYAQWFGTDLETHDQVNVLVVPMSLRDRVVGVLAIVRVPDAKRAAFTPHDIRQAADLAAQAAVAIEQALLFAKVRSYAKEVELSYDTTLKALMAALDAKDDVTEGHCERVARMTVHLARQMGMSDAAVVDMERGALLHDVGKIGVPDAVLKKPDALNDNEWEAMRKHPLLAGMMISKVAFLEGATPILLYHHERWDGGGYPFGLTGEKIPIEARLFAVIDAYDAMTSNRPYRDALSHEHAMTEIAAGSGTQFDPTVVVSFTQLIGNHPELRSVTSALRKRDTHHTEDFISARPDADTTAA